ncbi:MAG: hypothetical protein R6X33_13665 [Candidatus Brocadiia bacterium]
MTYYQTNNIYTVMTLVDESKEGGARYRYDAGTCAAHRPKGACTVVGADLSGDADASR